MTSRLLISLSLLLAWQKVCAQLAPADDFFNGGAQLYISNNVPAALERVENGLKIYPSDEKLKKLEQLLKQQQQSQQNQQNQSQQQQSQQQKSDDQKKQQPQNQQNQKDQQKQDEQKQNQSDQKKDEQQKQEQQKSSAEKQKDEQLDKREGQPVKPGEMTPEEAKRLLDAQKNGEQLLQLKPPEKPRDNSKPVKDW